MADLATLDPTADPTASDPQDPTQPGPFYATPAELAAAQKRLGRPAAPATSPAGPSAPAGAQPLYATPQEIDAAKASLNAPGPLARVGTDLGTLWHGVARAGTAIAEHSAALANKFTSGLAGGVENLARAGAPLLAGSQPGVAAGLEGAGDAAGQLASKADAAAEALKEKARSEGNLGVIHGTVPSFIPKIGGQPFDLTSMGAPGALAKLAGASVPYVAAAAAAPEVEAPAALARLAGPRVAQVLTTAAARSAAVAPVSAAQGIDPASSTLQGVANLTGNPTLQHLAKSPAVRVATELGLEGALNVLGEGVHGFLAARKAGTEDVLKEVTTAAGGGEPPPPPPPSAPATSAPPAAAPQRFAAAADAQATDPLAGKLQVTTFSDGSKIPTQYRLVPRQQVAASHDAFTFQPNPDATPGIQGRSYDADPAAQEAVRRMGLTYDADRALDPAANPAEGPPIVSSVPNAAGKQDAIAGTNRLLGYDQASAQRPDLVAQYREQLVQKAADFGINPDAARAALEADPSHILVREVVDPGGALQTPDQLAELNNLSDAPSAKVKSRSDDAAARARNLSAAPDALAHFGQTFEPDQTLSDYLGGSQGKVFLDKLQAEGVISPTETRSFVNASGVIDDAGRLKLQDMLRASVLEDPRIVERGGAIVKKLDASIPSLALLKTAPSEWDIGPTVKQAVTLIQDARDAGMKDVAALAEQGDLLGRPMDPAAMQLAHTMERSNPTQLRDRFRAYATAAQEAGGRSASVDLFPDMAATPAALQEKLFGVTQPAARSAVGEMSGISAAARSASVSENPVISASATQDLGAGTQPRSALDQASQTVSLPSSEGTTRRIAPPTLTGVRSGTLASAEVGARPQPTNSLPELEALGKGAEPHLRAALDDAAAAVPGAEVVGTRVKGGDRLVAAAAHPDLHPDARAAIEAYQAADPKAAPFHATPEEIADARHSLLGTAGGASPELVKALAGGGIGAAVGAKSDPEHPWRGAGLGFLLGATGQKILRAGLGSLVGPGAEEAARGAEALTKKTKKGVAKGLADLPDVRIARTERLPEPVARGVPAKLQPRQPIAPSVLEARPGLAGKSARDYFNVSRLNLPPELQDAVANRVEALAPSAQGVPKRVVSNSETTSAAARLLELKTPAEIAALDPKKMTGVEGVAIASLAKERTVTVGHLLEQLKDPNLAAPARKALEDKMLQANGEANTLVRAVMSGGSEQGRDLQANKILANLRSPEAALIKAQRFLGDRLLTPEEKTELLAHVNAGDERATAAYLAGLKKSSVPEQLVALRNAGLLTSLKNRITYISGSAINLFTEQAVNKPSAALADALTSYLLKTGQRTQFLGSNTGLYGTQIRRGLRDAMSRFADMTGLDELTQGGMPRDPVALRARIAAWAEKMQTADTGPHGLDAAGGIPRQVNITLAGKGRFNQALDVYSKASPRITAAIDGFVGPIAYRGAMVDAAESIARAEKTPAARMATRVQELVDAPTDEMIATAKLERDRITFQNDETMARLVNKWRGLTSAFPAGGQRDAANAAMHFLFPYLRTGANIAARVADYSGLAGVRAVVGIAKLSRALETGADAATIRAIQRDVAKLAGRAATGALGTFGVGAALYKEGLLSGAYPTDSRERDEWEREGKQANSIKVMGHWMPVARFTPVGGAMAAGANLAHALEHGNANADPAVRAFALAGAASRSALDNPLFTGAQSVMEAAQDPARAGGKLLQATTSSLVPTGVADVAKVLDQGTARQASGVVESLKERVPGLRSSLQPRITDLGDTVHGREGWASTFLNPFSGPAATDQDPTVRLLHDNKASLSKPKREGLESDKDLAQRRANYEDQTLPRLPAETPAQYTARQRTEGQAIRAALVELQESGELDETPDPDERQRLIDDVITRTRRAVRDDAKDAGLLRRKGA